MDTWLRVLFICGMRGSSIHLKCVDRGEVRNVTLALERVEIKLVAYGEPVPAADQAMTIRDVLQYYDPQCTVDPDGAKRTHELLKLHSPASGDRKLNTYTASVATKSLGQSLAPSGRVAKLFSASQITPVDCLAHALCDTAVAPFYGDAERVTQFYMNAHARRIGLDKHCWIRIDDRSQHTCLSQIRSLAELQVQQVTSDDIEQGIAGLPWHLVSLTDATALALGSGMMAPQDAEMPQHLTRWNDFACQMRDPEQDPTYFGQTHSNSAPAVVFVDGVIDAKFYQRNMPQKLQALVVPVNRLLDHLNDKCRITRQLPARSHVRVQLENSVRLALLVCAEAGVTLPDFLLGTQNAVSEAIVQSMLESDGCLPLPRTGPPKHATDSTPGVRGATILDAKEGLYATGQTSICDFSSYYPSLVCEYDLFLNVSGPRSRVDENRASNSIGSLLCRKRAQKSSERKAALKLACVAFYGSFLSAQARTYCPRLGQQILGKGRETLQNARAFFANRSLESIAGHTDSIIVHTEDSTLDIDDACAAFNRQFERGHVRLEHEISFSKLIIINRTRYLGVTKEFTPHAATALLAGVCAVAKRLDNASREHASDTKELLAEYAVACATLNSLIKRMHDVIRIPGALSVSLGIAGNILTCAVATHLALLLNGHTPADHQLASLKTVAASLRLPSAQSKPDDGDATRALLWSRVVTVEKRGAKSSFSHGSMCPLKGRPVPYAMYCIKAVNSATGCAELVTCDAFRRMERDGGASPHYAGILKQVVNMWAQCTPTEPMQDLVHTDLAKTLMMPDASKRAKPSTAPNSSATAQAGLKVSNAIWQHAPQAILQTARRDSLHELGATGSEVAEFVGSVLHDSLDDATFMMVAQQLLLTSDPVFWASHNAQDTESYAAEVSELLGDTPPPRKKIYDAVANAVSRKLAERMQPKGPGSVAL